MLLKMDVKKELEEGEIEDDGEFLQELEEKLLKKKKQNNKKCIFSMDLADATKTKSVPKGQKPEEAKNKENSRMTYNNKTTIADVKSYEMDDYELLLARHQLIQQQLEKVEAESQVKKKVRGKRRKSNKVLSKTNGINEKTSENEPVPKVPSEAKEIISDVMKQEATTEKPTQETQEKSVKDVTPEEDDLELSQMRAALLAQTLQKKTKDPQATQEENQHQPKNVVDLTNDTEIIDLTSDENVKDNVQDNISVPNTDMTLQNIQKKSKRVRNRRTSSNMQHEIPVLGGRMQTRSTAITKSPALIQPASLTATPKTGKKRKRGGKRAKMLAYRAQQKRELAILEQQQAIAFDNYNSVPMDIENDESNDVVDGVAPLPLIETTDVPPPPPPLLPADIPDAFKPVEDQMRLSMTTSTVAWMPGYMEKLEPDNSINLIHGTPNKDSKENESNNNQSTEGIEVDEKEVWALRAQALKSLACKRASKAKMTKKISPKAPKKNGPLNNSYLNDLSPLPSPTSISQTQPIAIPIKVAELVPKHKVPVHPPVVIKLSKEDFESSDDEDSSKIARSKVQKRRTSATDEELITKLRAYSEKAQTKIKSHSLLIQKDQVNYKKVNNELGETKILFRKQTEEVKALQAKLQAALREKANTKKSYNRIHSKLLDVKSDLKEKISLRKKLQEDLLKAKPLISFQRATENDKLSNKVRDHIINLSTSFRHALMDMSRIENDHLLAESSQDDEPISDSISSSETDVKKKMLRRTAANVKNMSKEDLSRLELELREQLKSYQRKKSSKTNNEKNEETVFKKISITSIPTVTTQSDLTKLRNQLIKDRPTSQTSDSRADLLKELQRHDVNTKKESVFSKELTDQPTRVQSKATINEKYEEKDVSFKYESPLLRFRSYRLSPYFRTQNKYSIKSTTFSNIINSRKTMCKFDLLGTCNDTKCSYWHFDDVCKLSAEDLIQDLVSYEPSLFEASDTMNSDTKQKLLHSFTQHFMTQYSGKISTEEQILVLWNKLKEHRKFRKVPLHECVSFARRDWLKLLRLKSQSVDDKNENISVKGAAAEPYYNLKNTKKVKRGKTSDYESQEIRYYSDAYETTSIMEKSLEENPNDVKLWLSLSRFYLKDKEANVEKSLGVLSRSLEANRNSEDLWIEYLTLFSKHGSANELREISYQAVMYSPTYNVWWTCLNLESTYIGKQEICTEMLKFILDMEDENEDFVSNSLLESLLYLCKLLQDRGRYKLAFDCLASALGMGNVDEKDEKISIQDLRTHLTLKDTSFLWICFLSFKCFNSLPAHLFPPEVSGPGRLVNKQNFVLDWQKKSMINNNEIRSTLKLAAYESFPDRPISPVKSSMILFENLAYFEIYTKNFQDAGDILRLLSKEERGFTDGWILLLMLYMKHSPMDAIVKIAEEALHKCDNDVSLVYIYSDWLFKKGMPNLALDKLTNCIHTYFQIGPDDPEYGVDILYLYSAVLGLEVPYTVSLPVYLPKASSGVKFYYWMCYCLLLKIREVSATRSLCNSAIDEAFERAVHQYSSRDNTKRLWEAYMDNKLDEFKGQTITSRMCNQLVDLLLRSVVAIPSSSSISENKNVLWKDFTFQNQMIDKCLHFVPVNQQSKVYQKLINLMPDNVTLALRICEHEMKMGNVEQVRHICGAILRNYPKYLPLWFMAIQVERKCNSIKEARWLFEEAVKSNQCNAKLWREYASFEIVSTNDSEKLDKSLNDLIERSLTNGIDLRDYLQNLSPG